MYHTDTYQSRTQDSFNLYLSFKMQFKLTLCPLVQLTNVLSSMVQVNLMNVITSFT